MKRSTIFAFLILYTILFANSVSAQNKIEVTETYHKFKTGNQFAFKSIVFETDAKQVSKKWESLMKDYSAKITGNKEEMFADNATIKNFNNNNTVDTYFSSINTKDGNAEFYVSVDLGGIYLSSSNKDAYSKMKEIIYNFSRDLSIEKVKDQISDAEKVFTNLENESKKLDKKKEDLLNDIEMYKDKINKAEELIKENTLNTESKKVEIESQAKAIKDLNEKLKNFN